MNRYSVARFFVLGAFASVMPGLVSPATSQPVRSVEGASSAVPASSDEFVGPFSSWRDARRHDGAIGDGVADDTDALQRGLANLSQGRHSSVLFIPAGTYRITRTLNISFSIFRSIVGADPMTTRIVWDGEAGGTMLRVNGLAYSRIVRLTFDGRRKAAVAVEQSWDGSRAHFDTGNEYSDDWFVDVEYGIRGGFLDRGFAETSVIRSRFIRNTGAGIAHGNFNALDTWIWYSTFEDCGVGVTNGTGAGNFHVYNSVFRGSRVADLFMNHTGGFSARGNYSSGSEAFFLSAENTNNPATIHLQGNTIIDPRGSTPINLNNQGPGLLTDNVIRSLPDASGPVVEWTSFFGPDVVSVGNRFTVPSPIRTNGRLVSLDDQIVERAAVAGIEPVLPPPLPSLGRRVFDVPPGASTEAIQAVIDKAALAIGSRPVVHIPEGEYRVTRTLVVPPGDLQIVGDGAETVLEWAGEGSGPVLLLEGPARTTLRELRLHGGDRADGLVVRNVDQPGARIYGQQLQLRSGRETGLLVNRLDHAHVQLEDFGHAYMPDAVMVKIVGGPLRARGVETDGRTSVFSGAASGGPVNYEVSKGGSLLVRDLWYETGGAAPGFARVVGRARFTADGLRVAHAKTEDVASFNIIGLDGAVAILSSHLDDHVRVTGRGNGARILVAATFCEQRFENCFRDTTVPSAEAAVVASRQISIFPGNRSAQAPEIGSADSGFLRRMLAHARREIPSILAVLPPQVSDVRLFRVWIENAANNMVLEP